MLIHLISIEFDCQAPISKKKKLNSFTFHTFNMYMHQNVKIFNNDHFITFFNTYRHISFQTLLSSVSSQRWSFPCLHHLREPAVDERKKKRKKQLQKQSKAHITPREGSSLDQLSIMKIIPWWTYDTVLGKNMYNLLHSVRHCHSINPPTLTRHKGRKGTFKMWVLLLRSAPSCDAKVVQVGILITGWTLKQDPKLHAYTHTHTCMQFGILLQSPGCNQNTHLNDVSTYMYIVKNI